MKTQCLEAEKYGKVALALAIIGLLVTVLLSAMGRSQVAMVMGLLVCVPIVVLGCVARSCMQGKVALGLVCFAVLLAFAVHSFYRKAYYSDRESFERAAKGESLRREITSPHSTNEVMTGEAGKMLPIKLR